MFIDGTLVIWLVLALAVIVLFLRAAGASFSLLITSLIMAITAGKLSLSAFAIVILVLSGIYFSNKKNAIPRPLLIIFVLVWCVALFHHWLPGFNNFHVLKNVQAKPLSIPFNMYLNLDKPLIFFSLFLVYPNLLGQCSKFKIRPVNYYGIACALLLLAMLLPAASILGKISPDFSLPSWWWLFAFNNLVFTCVVEEALFRGYIQQNLSRRFGFFVSIILTSMLFGVEHVHYGSLFVFFASLAGLGYGIVFHFSRRLWATVLTHFLFNFSWLLFYTYPMLKS